MRLLFDENISYRIVKKLGDIAPDSKHASRIDIAPPARDREIWAYARKNDFVIVSFDEDFQDLSNLYGFPPKVILLRLGNSTTDSIVEVIRNRWGDIQEFKNSEVYGLLEIY